MPNKITGLPIAKLVKPEFFKMVISLFEIKRLYMRRIAANSETGII